MTRRRLMMASPVSRAFGRKPADGGSRTVTAPVALSFTHAELDLAPGDPVLPLHPLIAPRGL